MVSARTRTRWKLAVCGCTVFVMIDAFCQPGYHAGWDRTLVGELCSELRGQARGTRCIMPSNWFAEPTPGGGWRVLGVDRYGASDFPHPSEVVVCRVWYQRSSGVWSLLWRTERDRVAMEDAATGVPVPAASCGGLLDAMERAFPGSFPARTRAADVTGGSSRTRILWLGVVNDGAVLAAATLCFVLSVRLWQTRRRSPTGKCATCGYDLSGLRENRCPECERAFGEGGEPRM